MSSLSDDEGWEDMPVIQPTAHQSTALDEEDRKRYHWNAGSQIASTSTALAGNAIGKTIDHDAAGREWREKEKLDEMDYTRLELDDDPEEDEISMRTQYLFNEEKGMTPLAQMQATKTLLTEGQRIAYVGLCRLVAREMVQTLRIASRGASELETATESAQNWANKIMGRLYRHMEVNGAEQRMIEQLAEHGVTAQDLVPSLVTTHIVDNPEYDPDAAAEMEKEALEAEQEKAKEEKARELNWEAERTKEMEETVQEMDDLQNKTAKMDITNSDPFGDENHVELPPPIPDSNATLPQFDVESDMGVETSADSILNDATPSTPSKELPDPIESPSSPNLSSNLLPSSLPGVSKTLTAADKTITLDIRWTILCDLFLSLIADSVYDARSRVLLGRIADKLGLDWLDVVRFERRLTEALEIQEGVQKKEHDDVLEEKRKQGKRQRYMMMSLATLGGGLVIGLSAGLLAPVIGAGLGAALTTVGVTGTTGFLAGAGGAAVVTSGGIIAGSAVGGKAMARRTRHVKTFEFQPLHNNKRVNFFIAVPGFMSGPLDDVRLPFSTIDPVMGDVFSVLWEPDMMGDTGNALKILTSEVLTQVGQQVLAMTVMTALLSALQWPMMLTKLGYLIDNPWSNALDRARQAGAVLADILINRHMGVRPVSLVGFSLGARVIFYALIELAKANAFGVVQEVYLFGATLTASKKTWRQVRGVVSGRFVNAYAMNDWVLGYLFRATSGGLNTVAGLRPIEHVPDLENVDITSILMGHMSYRTLMPTLLAHVGFKTTADHFDEPDEIDADAPEREVLTKKEEEERKEKKERSKLGIFGRMKSPNGSQTSLASGANTPSRSMSRAGSTISTDAEDDDLPPRLDSSSPTVKIVEPEVSQLKQTESTISLPSIEVDSPTPIDVDSFDIEKLRQEVAETAPVDVNYEEMEVEQEVDSRAQRAEWNSKEESNDWSREMPTPRARLPSLPLESTNGFVNNWAEDEGMTPVPEKKDDPFSWRNGNPSSTSFRNQNPW